MVQSNTLKHYLIIGLIINLIILLNSCDSDNAYLKVGEYHFVNETNYTITFPAGHERHNIAPKSTTVFLEKFNVRGKSGAELSDFISPFFSVSTTNILNIKFDNTKCLLDVKTNDFHSIRNIKEFVPLKIGKDSYKFTYTFTEADYNRAVDCP